VIAYGINPAETWEIDFHAERLRWTVENLREAARYARERATTEKAKPDGAAQKAEVEERLAAGFDGRAAALDAELTAYTPRTGPVFVVGHIPNALRAEIVGEADEIRRLPEGAERVKRDTAWAEKVVRYAIRGHSGLRTRRGEELPFTAEQLDGRASPARSTLEAYQAILGDLAILALRSQRLDEAGKNA
jgi:hypothetical protein